MMKTGIAPPVLRRGVASRYIDKARAAYDEGVKELPIACTLTPAAMTDRVEWLRRLGTRSLLDGRRHERTLLLRFDAGAEEEVRTWVRAEQECCAFLSFALERDARLVHLTVGAPAGAEPVLDGLLAALQAP